MVSHDFTWFHAIGYATVWLYTLLSDSGNAQVHGGLLAARAAGAGATEGRPSPIDLIGFKV